MKSLPEFHAGLRQHFPGIGNAGRFLCKTSLMLGSPRIDVITLDDWLHERHGEYENDGLSMADCIAKHYGEGAKAFVQSLI